MKHIPIVWMLSLAGALNAQTPTPEVGLDVNADMDALVAQGWPLLIRAAVISADGAAVNLGMANGAWTQALKLTITDQNGAVQKWPVQLMAPTSAALNLSGFTNAEAVWLVSPDATSSIAIGTYNLNVTLDTRTGAASGAWIGSVDGNASTVEFRAEPDPLSAEDEASKYLALSSYAQFQGDLQGAIAALDTLIADQPGILLAYTRKAALLAAGGDYVDALGLYQQTLDMFQAKNPDAVEPLTLLTAPMANLVSQLASQQSNVGTIHNAVAGGIAPVIAPGSIVTAHGARLAGSTASAVDCPAASLGGVTVTITDSTGAPATAPLLYISPGKVQYIVPPALALGAAKVVVTTADGSIRRGAVTIVNVQPGLISAQVVDGELEINATGIRRAAKEQVKVTLGGVTVPVLSVAASGSAGIDRIQVPLPSMQARGGGVPLVLTAAGKPSQALRIAVR